MIKINLIESPIEVLNLELAENSLGSKRKYGIILGVVALLCIGFGIYNFGFSSQDIAAPEVVLNDPHEPQKPIDQAVPGVVEDPVKEMQAPQEDVEVAPVTGTRQAPTFTENIKAQRLFAASALEKFYEASPSGVGFSSVVVRYPDFYYIKGIADDKDIFETIRSKIEMSSSDFKTEPLKSIGVTKVAQQFVIYGRLKTSSRVNSSPRALSSQNYNDQIEKLKSMASSAGLNSVDLSGKASTGRGVVKLSAVGNYPQFKNFLNLFKDSKLDIGVQQMQLNATENENVSAEIELIVYGE
jgi:hypothetical protein